MRRLEAMLRTAASMMRDGHMRQVAPLAAAKLRRSLWSERRSLMLRRDLLKEPALRPGGIAFAIRPFEPDDIRMLGGEPISAEDARARAQRRGWIEAGLPGCHVATLKDGEPCYMQWVLSARDNGMIRALFGAALPQLDVDTVLLEGAYMAPRYRRIPIMPAAMAKIAALGRDRGARYAIVYVGEENTSMIKAAQWAGFVPDCMETERLRFFRRSASQEALSAVAAS